MKDLGRAFKGAGRKREMPGFHAKEATCLNQQEHGHNGSSSGTQVMEESLRGVVRESSERDEG